MRSSVLATPLALVIAVAVSAGCRNRSEGAPPPSPAPSASVAPPVAGDTPKEKPSRAIPLVAAPFEATTPDGVVLSGSLARSPDPGVPVVLFVHHWAGSREEWRPLLERLAHAMPAPHLAAVDLRGHGASTRYAGGSSNKGASPIAWHLMSNKDALAAAKDLPVVFEAIDAALGAPARAFVVVGDDFGATAAVLAATEPRVTALALVSPGAALRGVDVYRPFAALRERPVFLACSSGDPISNDPVNALGAMAKGAIVERYPGEAHTARQIAEKHAELWDDLEEFVLGPAMHGTPDAPDRGGAAPAASSGAHGAHGAESVAGGASAAPSPKPAK